MQSKYKTLLAIPNTMVYYIQYEPNTRLKLAFSFIPPSSIFQKFQIMREYTPLKFVNMMTANRKIK